MTKAGVRRLGAVTRVLAGVIADEKDARKLTWVASWDDDTVDWLIDLLLRVREAGRQDAAQERRRTHQESVRALHRRKV
jgi:hypothetical protein